MRSDARRVLLVGIDALVLQVMKSTLDRNGFEVDTAMDAVVAADLFAEHRHAVLVVDGDEHAATMPLLRDLSSLPTDCRPLAIVACEAGTREACENELAVESLTRPLSLRYLVARLNEHFGVYPAVVNAA